MFDKSALTSVRSILGTLMLSWLLSVFSIVVILFLVFRWHLMRVMYLLTPGVLVLRFWGVVPFVNALQDQHPAVRSAIARSPMYLPAMIIGLVDCIFYTTVFFVVLRSLQAWRRALAASKPR